MQKTYKQKEFDFSDKKKTSQVNLTSILYYEQLIDPQPELPVNESEEGYDQWHKENKERMKRIEEEWHVPLYKGVKFWLKNIPGTFIGKLTLKEYPKEPFDNIKHDLHLVLEDIEFRLDNRNRPRPEFMSSEIFHWRLI